MAAEAGGVLDARHTIGIPDLNDTDAHWESWRVKFEAYADLAGTSAHICNVAEQTAFITNEDLDAAAVLVSRTAHALLITQCEGKVLSLASLVLRRDLVSAARSRRRRFRTSSPSGKSQTLAAMLRQNTATSMEQFFLARTDTPDVGLRHALFGHSNDTDHVVKASPSTWPFFELAMRSSSRRLSLERLRLSVHAARYSGSFEDFSGKPATNLHFKCLATGNIVAAWRATRSHARWRGRSRSSLTKSGGSSALRAPSYQLYKPWNGVTASRDPKNQR